MFDSDALAFLLIVRWSVAGPPSEKCTALSTDFPEITKLQFMYTDLNIRQTGECYSEFG